MRSVTGKVRRTHRGHTNLRHHRGKAPLRIGVKHHLRGLSGPDLSDQDLWDPDFHFGRGIGGQSQERLAGRDVLVDLDVHHTDGTVHRGYEAGVLDLLPRLRQPFGGRLYLGGRRLGCRPPGVELGLGGVIVLIESPGSIVVRFGLTQASSSLGETGLALLDRELEIGGIETSQNLAATHPVAELDLHRLHRAPNPKAQAGLDAGAGSPGIGDALATGARLDQVSPDRSEGGFRDRYLFRTPCDEKESGRTESADDALDR